MYRQLPDTIKAEITTSLNRQIISENDWRNLAKVFGYASAIEALKAKQNPAEELLNDWQTRKEATITNLHEALTKMHRDDLASVIERSPQWTSRADSSVETKSILTVTQQECATVTQPASALFERYGVRVPQPTSFPPTRVFPEPSRPTYAVCPLVIGYATSDGPGHQRATGSSTLFRGPLNVVVDTGSPWDRDQILESLSRFGVSCDSVHYVVATHGHSDHVGNLNLFQNAVIILSYDVAARNSYRTYRFNDGVPYTIDDWIQVIFTPGHSHQDLSVVVKDTEYGTVVAAGDLFECEADLAQPRLWHDFAEDKTLQERHRGKVLTMADAIIPGHGRIFLVPKHFRR